MVAIKQDLDLDLAGTERLDHWPKRLVKYGLQRQLQHRTTVQLTFVSKAAAAQELNW